MENGIIWGGNMGRKPRVIYNGALYHIIQRGNNRNYIYEDINDKKMFFKILLETREKYDFKILYYVLMDNHYHIILEVGETSISKVVQWLNTRYSKYYNKKYNRTGSIYGGRYTCHIISDTKYYFKLLNYIAANPMKAKIVKNTREYRWSAHQQIISKDSSIVDIEKTLSYFPSPRSMVMQEYIELIENESVISSNYGMLPIKDSRKISDALDYLMVSLNFKEGISEKIKGGDKSYKFNEERGCFIKAAYEAGFKIKDIANYIKFTYEGVRKIVK